MRHLLSTLAAAAFVVGLGLSQAHTAPLPQLNGPATQASPIEPVGYYGYGYGYRRYGGYYPYHRNYWRPWYYRPHYYGYYRPHYYGYWNRPYYRRYW